MLLTTFVLISLDFQYYCGFTCKIAKDFLKMPNTSMATEEYGYINNTVDRSEM